MTVFANKNAFFGLGVKKVEPSPAHISQDCSICTKPLAVQCKVHSPHSTLQGYHEAVRIGSCGHVHGSECLSAWLSVGNSCPTCHQVLFEANNGEAAAITQGDVNDVLHTLGQRFGEARITIAIANAMQDQERARAMARRYHEQQAVRQDTANSNAGDREFLLGEDDLLDSDGEMDWEEDEEGGDDEDDEYLDDGDVEDDE